MEKLAAMIWGVPTMALLLAVGAVLSWETGFVQIRKLGTSMKQVCRSLRKNRSSFRAVCTALAGTVGTGNIAGVAGAVALGGPGAVFWMWVAAFLGMATKYAEVVLALRHRKRDASGVWQCGAMYMISQGMGARWKPMAGLFAFSAVLVSLGMGNLAQVHTVTSAVQTAFPAVQPTVLALGTGLCAALLTVFASAGGAERIGAVTEKLVPAASCLYVCGTAAVLVLFRHRLGQVFLDILQGAFYPQAVLGGGVGIGFRQAVRWGVSRGVFSNEAGLGSAPMAHGMADELPEVQGLFGIFEVFLDTIVLCTLTALAILVSGVPVGWGTAAGAELVSESLKTVFGPAGTAVLAVCLALLAQGSLLTWQLYGDGCVRYLWGEPGAAVYRWIFPAVTLLGSSMELSAVWAASDLCNGLMCLPNLIALLALRKQVRRKAPCKTG